MSKDAEQLPKEKDPTRLCPVCRMPISILAVRCRFCGAEVGRPRKEQETFTVKDLGGNQQSSYTLSGNVTEALEAFISEERAQIEAKERERQAAARKSFLRRSKSDKTPAEPVTPSSPGLPELDAAGRDLASVTTSSTRSQSIKARQVSPLELLGKKTLVAAALVAGLILLYFGTDFAWAHIRRFLNSPAPNEQFTYPNRAEEFYAAGTPIVEVLDEALTALRYNDTEENRSIAEKMRRRLIEDIEKKAFAKPFDMEKLNQASREINRAGSIDSHADIVGLMDEVNREVSYFKFILTRVDIDTETAVFRLNNSFVTEREESVSVGDMLQGRFLVKSITPREVLLEDVSPKGSGRQLLSRRMEAVEAFR